MKDGDWVMDPADSNEFKECRLAASQTHIPQRYKQHLMTDLFTYCLLRFLGLGIIWQLDEHSHGLSKVRPRLRYTVRSSEADFIV